VSRSEGLSSLAEGSKVVSLVLSWKLELALAVSFAEDLGEV